MDTYHEHPGDFDLPASPDSAASHDVAATIGTDERRMHVRAYNHWVSLLDTRDFPSIEDLEPADVSDFAANSVLLDFTCGRDNPAIPYIGTGIREECGLDDDTRTIADVPSRSLLSRLTDHYMQIIANRAPIGFEAEFANQREETICYRGILMPFSSDGETIDFIYGVINWKRVGAESKAEGHPEEAVEMPRIEFDLPAEADELEGEAPEPLELTEPVHSEAVAEPTVQPDDTLEIGAIADVPEAPAVHFSWEDGPLGDVESGEMTNIEQPNIEMSGIELPNVDLDENAGLADRLWAARETAEAVKAGEGRSRAALYHALSLAYDFALAANENAEDYAELLDESGVKAQARAPMTPIVKLVFGIDYDKARLTEFAAALSYAVRQEIELGGFQSFIEKQNGGLKALVAAERQARRPDVRPDTKSELARARLRTAPTISLDQVPAGDEFAVVVTRRGADGRHQPIAIIDDDALLERAIRRAG